MPDYCNEHKTLMAQLESIQEALERIEKNLFGTNGTEGLFEVTRRQERRWQIVTRILWGMVLAIAGIIAKFLCNAAGIGG